MLIDQIAYLDALEALTHDAEGRVFPDEMFTEEDIRQWMTETSSARMQERDRPSWRWWLY